MKSVLIAIASIILISCGNSNSSQETPRSETTSENVTSSATKTQPGAIMGEWEQQYTCFDTNGNYKLEPEEKKPSNTRTGFNWFRFNADGSCLRDKEMQFKSTYAIKDKGDTKELAIQNVHAYTIIALTDSELILGAEGAFMVFKKI